jgi:hypothetical protein
LKINPPPPPPPLPPAEPEPPSGPNPFAPFPPAPIPFTAISVILAGTVKVPDDKNV